MGDGVDMLVLFAVAVLDVLRDLANLSSLENIITLGEDGNLVPQNVRGLATGMMNCRNCRSEDSSRRQLIYIYYSICCGLSSI